MDIGLGVRKKIESSVLCSGFQIVLLICQWLYSFYPNIANISVDMNSWSSIHLIIFQIKRR